VKLFVYGTLRMGEIHHHYLDASEFLGESGTARRYRLLDLGAYPALIEGGTTNVIGELYHIEPSLLARLDELEGHPHEYRRATIALADGGEAIAYLWSTDRVDPSWRVIACGDWRKRND
jgi:gamma-glutamylaminecyclotransferase